MRTAPPGRHHHVTAHAIDVSTHLTLKEITMDALPRDEYEPVSLRPMPTSEPVPPAVGHVLTTAPYPEELAPHGRLRRYLSRIVRQRRLARPLVLRALAVEQDLIGRPREPGTVSFAENVIHSLGAAAGNRELAKTQRTLGRLAKRADSWKAKQSSLIAQAAHSEMKVVPHPDGGVRTVEDTVSDQDWQRAAINVDIQGGSRRHQRLPRALRRIPALVFAADALLLLYFFSGVTNVDWTSPLSAALVFATLLAAMVTGVSFAFFHFAGDRLRQYKNDAGTVPLRGLDEVTMTAAALALAAIMVLSTLMFTRMDAEVMDALGSGADGTAIVIGVTLGVVSILANTLVVAVAALDGSAEGARLDALGIAVADSLKHAWRNRAKADKLGRRIAVLASRADRITAEGITKAGRQRAAADRLIDAARAVHQGTGPLSEPAADPNGREGVVGYHGWDAIPQVDERPIRITLRHVHEALDERRLTDPVRSVT